PGNTGSTTPPNSDTTAPIISAAAVGSLASTSAIITWTTNEPATSKVYFSTSTPLSLATAMTVIVPGLVTVHSATLSSFAASTTYAYVIESADVAGNTATTTAATVTTSH